MNPLSAATPLTHADAPPWACGWGEDEYGLYADFEYRGVVQRMRWIGPGRFWMGSPESEAERWRGETRHEVTLTEGYWLADTACTQELWEVVMGGNPSHFKEEPASPQHPVEQVSWDDCAEFLAKVNAAVPELNLRLPTEAEWERACRAGTETPFSFGETITPEQVNYDGNYPYAGGAKGKYREKTLPVKELQPNGWGLYQMHGNVDEWCNDWFQDDYGTEPAVDPEGPETGDRRVLRGGSWFNIARLARSAYRVASEPGLRDDSLGFRVARGR